MVTLNGLYCVDLDGFDPKVDWKYKVIWRQINMVTFKGCLMIINFHEVEKNKSM
jgi:hypothetical protein